MHVATTINPICVTTTFFTCTPENTVYHLNYWQPCLLVKLNISRPKLMNWNMRLRTDLKKSYHHLFQELSDHTTELHVQHESIDGLFSFYDSTRATLNIYQVWMLYFLCFHTWLQPTLMDSVTKLIWETPVHVSKCEFSVCISITFLSATSYLPDRH